MDNLKKRVPEMRATKSPLFLVVQQFGAAQAALDIGPAPADLTEGAQGSTYVGPIMMMMTSGTPKGQEALRNTPARAATPVPVPGEYVFGPMNQAVSLVGPTRHTTARPQPSMMMFTSRELME